MRKRKLKITPEISAYFAELGKRSKGGGRPRIPDEEMTEAQRLRRDRYERMLSKSPASARKTAQRGGKRPETASLA